MLARKTAERKYAEWYRRLDPEDPAREFLVDPDGPLRVRARHGMNSDLQAVAVIFGKAFEDAFYQDYLMAKFYALGGERSSTRSQTSKLAKTDPVEAMRRMVANGQLKPIRCANLSFIHRDSKIYGSWKNAYPVELVPWPRPILQDFSGRLLIQPVDRRVVLKAQKMATPSSLRCPGKWDGVSPESLVHIHTGRSVCVAARWRAHAGVAAAQTR